VKGNCEETMETPGDIGPSTLDQGEPDSEPPLRLSLDVVIENGDWPDAGSLDALVSRTAAVIAAAVGLSRLFALPASACVAFSSNADVRALNAQYRGQDKPTNVLSFPAPPPPPGHRPEGEPLFLGDVVLAAETVAAEARDQGIPIAHHIQHLVVHGVLHLLGYDHEDDSEAETMEALETRLLADLGVPDPYLGNG
jgi:probable rRNA maturation factor